MGESGADLCCFSGGDAQQLVVARREHVVRVTTCGPHHVVLGESDVDNGAQRLRVTYWRNTPCGFRNPRRGERPSRAFVGPGSRNSTQGNGMGLPSNITCEMQVILLGSG